ncbi:hypothetical protein D3C73_667970 [compost metagenome]
MAGAVEEAVGSEDAAGAAFVAFPVLDAVLLPQPARASIHTRTINNVIAALLPTAFFISNPSLH